MRKIALALGAVALLSFGAAGCANITSNTGKSDNHFIVKNKGYPCGSLMTWGCWSSEVYYCPTGGGQCKKAQIEGESD